MVIYPKLDMNYATFNTANDDKIYTTSDTLPADSLRDNEGGYSNPIELENGAVPSSTPEGIRNSSTAPSRDKKDPHDEEEGCCASFEEFCLRRSETERWLVSVNLALGVICLGFLIALILFAKYGYGFHFPGEEDGTMICKSSHCVKAAGDILRSMDTSVPPCENFHKYTCGGWKERNPMPPMAGQYNTFYKEFESLHFEIKEIIEGPVEKDEPKPMRELRKAYRACTNESQWKNRGVGPLINTLLSVGGLPPMLDNLFDFINYDWTRMVATLRRSYYESHLISIDVGVDIKNVSRYTIYVDAGYLPVSADLLSSNDTNQRKWYIDSMVDAAMLIRNSLTIKNEKEGIVIPFKRKKSLNSSILGELEIRQDLLDALLQQGNPNSYVRRSNETEEIQHIIEYIFQNSKSSGTTEFKRSKHPFGRLDNFIDYKRSIANKSKRSLLDFDLSNLLDIIARLVIEQHVKDTWEFYISLSNIMPEEKRKELRYNPMTIKELQQWSDPDLKTINWLHFIGDIFSGTSIVLEEDTQIIVSDPDYFKSLFILLNQIPNRVIANAILMQFALNLGSDISPRESNDGIVSQTESDRYIGRLEQRTWLDCANKMNNLMGFAVTSLYVRRHAYQSKADKNTVELLARFLQDSLVETLKADTWMQLETQWQAVKKARNMIPRVAYSEEVFNDTIVELYYQGLPEMDDEKHFENMMNFLHYYSFHSLAKLENKPSRSSWVSSGLQVNAFYDGSRNSIQIPLGILRPPYFWRNTITPLMYGGVGAVVSHEILHAFDINGRKRNWEGSLTNWWTNDSLTKYLEKAECFEQQYSLLPLTEDIKAENGTLLKVDGVATNAENIADSEGLLLAWSAFQERKLSHEIRLVGMEDVTEDQLFFISYGQMWCSSFTEDGLREALKYDVHTPPPFRVDGAIRNHPHFAKTFNCPLNSTMTSNTKCPLWL